MCSMMRSQGKVIIIEGTHVDPVQFLSFSQLRCVFVPVLVMPAQGSSHPRSVMQRSHILQLFCESTASSDTEKLQIYESNVQWLHSYLSTFSSKMYTSSHRQICICITSYHVTSSCRVCFDSREAQHVVLDQLQAIILEVNTAFERIFDHSVSPMSCHSHTMASENVSNHRGATTVKHSS